jgi:hypothetical protein
MCGDVMEKTVYLALPLLLGACAEYRISEDQAHAYAKARCSASLSCCEYPAEPHSECVAERVERILGYEDIADGTLEFSEACMESVLDWSASGIQCQSADNLQAPNCRLAHGTLALGAPCIALDDLGYVGNDCRRDLECVDGRCIEPPSVVESDAPEVVPIGGHCDDAHACRPGGVCGSDQICQATVAAACRDD